MKSTLMNYVELQAEKAESLSFCRGIKLLHIRDKVEEMLSFIGKGGIFEEYTKHNIDHIDEMLKIIEWIIPDETKKNMTAAEWLMLTLAVYFHDLGMVVTKEEYLNRDKTYFKTYKDSVMHDMKDSEYIEYIRNQDDHFMYQEFVRENHARRIRQWIENKRSTDMGDASTVTEVIEEILKNIDKMFKVDLAMICESHHLDDIDDFSKYKVIAAPVLYMVKEGMKEKLEEFVRNGGTLITTFMSGIVNQSDNVHLGGYPGPLRKMAGVWVEEIDALAPEQSNTVRFADGTEYKCNLLCDLMHTEGAEVLASYESDFYAGMPAVTKNSYGKGKVYYVATQFEAAGLAKVLDEVTKESAVSGVIAEKTGLEITCRESDTTRFYFVMNFTDEEQVLPVSLAGKTDLITGETAKEGEVMKKWDVKILQEAL